VSDLEKAEVGPPVLRAVVFRDGVGVVDARFFRQTVSSSTRLEGKDIESV
jgi:hypothetical protein